MTHLIPHAMADLFPLMDAESFEALKADIAANGQREPIWLFEGRIIDGRNRYRACRELKLTPVIKEWKGKGSLVAFVVSLNLHRRHLTPSQKAMVALEVLPMLEAEAKERQKRKPESVPEIIPEQKSDARDEAAKLFNVNPHYVSDAKRVKEEDAALAEQVKAGAVTLPEAVRTVKKRRKAKAKPCIVPLHEPASGIVSDLATLTGQQFGTIYADPPWQYSNQQTRAATDDHYKTLTVDQLCDMDIGSLAADDAHLHLWTTNAFLFDAKRVMDAWGFEYRSCFVWVKPQMGIGNYWRVSHEFLLLGIRGDAKRFSEHNHMSWMSLDRAKHSAKPEQIRHIIERVSPGPFLELFGRSQIEGWTVFGNQVERRLIPA